MALESFSSPKASPDGAMQCFGATVKAKNQAIKRNIPVPVQVCSTLGFLATGTFQREIGDRSGISQPSISRTMPAVLAAIMSLSEYYIKFPYNNDQQTGIKQDFYAIARFPNVIGAVDCTHVRMKPPSINDYAYINRKSYHSVNVQIICDARMSILNMVARWPGGTHDSFIFQIGRAHV